MRFQKVTVEYDTGGTPLDISDRISGFDVQINQQSVDVSVLRDIVDKTEPGTVQITLNPTFRPDAGFHLRLLDDARGAVQAGGTPEVVIRWRYSASAVTDPATDTDLIYAAKCALVGNFGHNVQRGQNLDVSPTLAVNDLQYEDSAGKTTWTGEAAFA